ATRTERVHVAPVGFGLRVDLGIAVHLAGGGQEIASVVSLRQPERVERTNAVDLEGVDGMPQVVSGAGRTGEVQDEVNGVIDDERLRDVLPQESEPGVASEMGQVPGRSRQQVVGPNDVPVLSEKMVAEVRAQKPGGSGDQHGRGRSAAGPHTGTRCRTVRGVASPRPRLWYSNPAACIRAGSNRFRPSTMIGVRMSDRIPPRSSERNSSQSVRMTSASAPRAASTADAT